MRFAEGFRFREIAHTLGLHERRIYSRVRRLLAEIRRRLRARGVDCSEVLDLLDEPQVELSAGLSEDTEATATLH